MWSDMLSHQLPVLPPLNDFWDALPEIFTWMTSGAPIPQRALIQHGAGEVAVRTRVLPMGVPLRSRSTLEIIRFAAANHLCVDLTYDGSVRRIEPYSLAADGGRIFCAACHPHQIQASTVRIAWTGCRARPSRRRSSRRATRLN